MSKTDPESLVRDCFQAWADSDRDWLEALLADDFQFTSPLDNRLDRDTYFRHCWPNGSMIVGFDIKHLAVDGDLVFVTYEGQNTGGKVFRNRSCTASATAGSPRSRSTSAGTCPTTPRGAGSWATASR